MNYRIEYDTREVGGIVKLTVETSQDHYQASYQHISSLVKTLRSELATQALPQPNDDEVRIGVYGGYKKKYQMYACACVNVSNKFNAPVNWTKGLDYKVK